MHDAWGAESEISAAFQDQWGRVVATLIRLTGDWDLAEECVQDAFDGRCSAGRWTASRAAPGPG